jgi:hypothetical protein
MCMMLPLAACLLTPEPPEIIPVEVQPLSLPTWCMKVSEETFDTFKLGKTVWRSYHWRYVFRYNSKIYSVTYFDSPKYKATVTSGRCFERETAS